MIALLCTRPNDALASFELELSPRCLSGPNSHQCNAADFSGVPASASLELFKEIVALGSFVFCSALINLFPTFAKFRRDSRESHASCPYSCLFIYPSICLGLLFSGGAGALLELIEYDPLTAVWNNEASLPHIFSPGTSSLLRTRVHIKGTHQCNLA